MSVLTLPSHRFKLLVVLLAGLAGCGGPATPSGAGDRHKADSPRRQQFAGVEFVPPPGWSIEKVTGLLLLTAPEIEGNWQANLSLELREYAEDLSLEQRLEDLVQNLRVRKQPFQEVSRQVENHRSGFRFGRIEYTCANQETGLTEWEIVIELEGNKRLFVLASSASLLWSKYQPVFERFVELLRRVPAEAGAEADRPRDVGFPHSAPPRA